MSNLLGKVHHKLDTTRKYKPELAVELMKEYEVKYPSQTELESAKRLHASIYLERSFIVREHIENDTISMEHDPYQKHAVYFVVKAKTNTPVHKIGEVVALARQIETTEKGLESLPMMQHTKVHLKGALHRDSQPYEYVEISALVKKRQISSSVLLLLFRAMFQHSGKKGHKTWLMACDEKIYWRLKTLFPYAIRKIGPKTFYMGSFVIPASVNITQIERSLKYAHLLSPPPFRKLRKGLREIMYLNVLADL